MNRIAFSLGLLISVFTATLLGGIQPASAGLSCYRPDAQVRGGPADTSYSGNNVYNTDGAGQTESRHVRPDHADGFKIKLENDSIDCSDTFFVTGDGNSGGFTVQYLSGSTDVTASVEAGSFSTGSLPLGSSAYLKVLIFAHKNVNDGTVKKVLVTAASAGTKGAIRDTVGAKVTVRRGAGDSGGGSVH